MTDCLQLCDGLSHLAQVSRPPPNIKTEYVSDYIEHGIQRFFLARVNQSAAATTNSGLLDQVGVLCQPHQVQSPLPYHSCIVIWSFEVVQCWDHKAS